MATIDFSWMTTFFDKIVTLMTYLFVTIPGKFISTTLSSGPLFNAFTTLFDNNAFQRAVFVLIIAGGPLLYAIYLVNRSNTTGRNKIANKR